MAAQGRTPAEKPLEPWHFCGPCFGFDHKSCTGYCKRSSECGRTCECADNGHDEMPPTTMSRELGGPLGYLQPMADNKVAFVTDEGVTVHDIAPMPDITTLGGEEATIRIEGERDSPLPPEAE